MGISASFSNLPLSQSRISTVKNNRPQTRNLDSADSVRYTIVIQKSARAATDFGNFRWASLGNSD
jgi:hypothetical protein